MKTLLSLLLFIHLFACDTEPTETTSITGTVVSIADGDTFTMLTENKRQVKIRLHGIDCPERNQDFGQVAKKYLSTLVFGKPVKVMNKGKDQYGRTIGIVFDSQNNCINEEMLKSGLAWHYTRYDRNPQWQEMENEARQNKLGLWSQPNSTPPWKWRKKK